MLNLKELPTKTWIYIPYERFASFVFFEKIEKPTDDMSKVTDTYSYINASAVITMPEKKNAVAYQIGEIIVGIPSDSNTRLSDKNEIEKLEASIAPLLKDNIKTIF